jgi:hypothetical protein
MIATFEDEPYRAPFSGNVIELCPVGALTSTQYRFEARPWEIQNVPTVCGHCPVGCNISATTREGKVKRILSRNHPEVDEGWLCDKGRFAFTHLRAGDRLEDPLRRKSDGDLEPIGWTDALDLAEQMLTSAGAATVTALSGSETVEQAYGLARLLRGGLGAHEAVLTEEVPDELDSFRAPLSAIRDAPVVEGLGIGGDAAFHKRRLHQEGNRRRLGRIEYARCRHSHRDRRAKSAQRRSAVQTAGGDAASTTGRPRYRRTGRIRYRRSELQRLSGETNRDQSKQGNLAERPSVREIGARLSAGADRFSPIPRMPFETREFLRRRVLARILIHQTFRREITFSCSVRAVDDHPLLSHNDTTCARHLVIRPQTFRFRNRGIAVEPDQFHGAAPFFGRELEGDFRAGGIV